jgi:hypothetical protein
MQNRRMFLGSAAGIGAGLAGYSVHQLVPSAAAQQRGSEPVIRELHQQLRLGIPKLIDADGDAARQVATTLRIYAATQSNARAVVQQAVRTKGRAALLHAPFDHDEMQRLATELAFPLSLLPPHAAPDPAGRDKALDLLLDEGLDALMRQVADVLETTAPSWDERAAVVQRAALQCPNCDWACALVPTAEQAMTIACAAVPFFPPAAEVCAAASATFITVLGVCIGCQIAVGC